MIYLTRAASNPPPLSWDETMKTAINGLLGVAAIFAVSTASAQHYVPHTTTHIDHVPHTTTHIDYQRHGNHVHAVPHTTTHIDQVPHTTTHFDRVVPHTRHRPVIQQQGAIYQQGQGRVIQPRRVIQQGRVIYPQGHVTSHTDVVPHTTTHIDYQRHGNHVDAIPHTTTHYDRVQHTSPGSVVYQQGASPVYRSARPVIGLTPHVQGRTVYPGQVHTNTHIDYVPHTTTHIDYQRHGNHLHAVPHTTTHVDAVPHTTTHVHH